MKRNLIIIKKNQKGQAALLIVLIIMGLLLFVGLVLTNMTAKQTKTTRDSLQSVQAYYLADAGAERLLYLTKASGATMDPGEYEAGNPLKETFFNESIPGIGSMVAIKTSDSPLRVKVTGYFKNTARAVELSY